MESISNEFQIHILDQQAEIIICKLHITNIL